jgi:hypothetical protein
MPVTPTAGNADAPGRPAVTPRRAPRKTQSGSYTYVDVIRERNRGWTLVDYAAAGRQLTAYEQDFP